LEQQKVFTRVNWTALEKDILDAWRARRPELAACHKSLAALHEVLAATFDGGGTLFVCGNGGSQTDAMHIVGELAKSFERRRPIAPEFSGRLAGLPHAEALTAHLENGFRAHALGCNPALKTAIENDIPAPQIAFAQELHVLARPGDVLLAISTSGNALNCQMALSVARAHGLRTGALTGPGGGAIAHQAEIILRAPGASTSLVQEAHVSIWHTLCQLIEARYFPEPR
jgi:D-sedoheptulose 7-phosphate isomerase